MALWRDAASDYPAGASWERERRRRSQGYSPLTKTFPLVIKLSRLGIIHVRVCEIYLISWMQIRQRKCNLIHGPSQFPIPNQYLRLMLLRPARRSLPREQPLLLQSRGGASRRRPPPTSMRAAAAGRGSGGHRRQGAHHSRTRRCWNSRNSFMIFINNSWICCSSQFESSLYQP